MPVKKGLSKDEKVLNACKGVIACVQKQENHNDALLKLCLEVARGTKLEKEVVKTLKIVKIKGYYLMR